MSYRAGVAAAVLIAGLAPGVAEATLRMSLAIAKSWHPGGDSPFSTVHPAVGGTGPVLGEWLRWRAGLVWHSYTRVGPFAGLAATWQVAESWRIGLSAGLVGNYPHGGWTRRGVVPIAQWQGRGRDLVWEFGLARKANVTFAGVSVQIPFSALKAR